MKPKISVIVPVFNRSNLIVRCLDSIINQTFPPFEIIIVDNASTDETYAVVERWMQANSNKGIPLLLLTEEKRGACHARQKGLENASGDYISFFDSDDMMRSGLIERVSQEIESRPEIDIISFQNIIYGLDGKEKIPAIIKSDLIESHLIHSQLRTLGYIVKKEFLIKAGGWRKKLPVWDDYELGLRLLLKNPDFIFIDEILADIYPQEESISGVSFSLKQGEWESTLDEMEKDNSETNHPQKKKIGRIINYRRAILAAHYYREKSFKEAENLLNETLGKVSPKDKILLMTAYRYTRRGGRGIWRLLRHFY